MWWDDLATFINDLAIPGLIVTILGVYLHYVYSDRAKREEFRRHALYERKLAAYRAIVSTARTVSELFAWVMRWNDPEKLAARAVKDLPETDKADTAKGLAEFITLLREMEYQRIQRRVGQKSEVTSLPSFKALKADFSEPLKLEILVELMDQ